MFEEKTPTLGGRCFVGRPDRRRPGEDKEQTGIMFPQVKEQQDFQEPTAARGRAWN